MSHIVIHDDSSNVTHYAEFDDLQAAASYLEDLVNEDAESNARLFALEPVEFAVKSYVKIEIGTADATVSDADDASESDAPEPATADAVVFTDAPEEDTVEYVEAAMAPVDAYAVAPPSEPVDDLGGGDARRGLFGR